MARGILHGHQGKPSRVGDTDGAGGPQLVHARWFGTLTYELCERHHIAGQDRIEAGPARCGPRRQVGHVQHCLQCCVYCAADVSPLVVEPATWREWQWCRRSTAFPRRRRLRSPPRRRRRRDQSSHGWHIACRGQIDLCRALDE